MFKDDLGAPVGNSVDNVDDRDSDEVGDGCVGGISSGAAFGVFSSGVGWETNFGNEVGEGCVGGVSGGATFGEFSAGDAEGRDANVGGGAGDGSVGARRGIAYITSGCCRGDSVG